MALTCSADELLKRLFEGARLSKLRPGKAVTSHTQSTGESPSRGSLPLDSRQSLDPQVAEAVGSSFFAVVLDSDGAGGVAVIGDVGGGDAVDFDFNLPAIAGDAVGVPVVAFEGSGGTGFEGGLGGGIALDRADEPHAQSFIIEAAGPHTFNVPIHLCLVSSDAVGFYPAAEYEAAVRFAFGQVDIAFKNEVGVGFCGAEKKLFLRRELDLAIHHFRLAKGVGVGPSVEGLAVEKGQKAFSGGGGWGDASWFCGFLGDGRQEQGQGNEQGEGTEERQREVHGNGLENSS